MIVLLAATLLGLFFGSLILTALADYSRSKLEKYCAVRKARKLGDILEHDDDAVLALRTWNSLMLAIALAGVVGAANDALLTASGDAGVAGPSDALLWWWTIQRAAFAWVALVGVELWLARPLGRLYAEPLLYWTWPAVNFVRVVLSPAIGLERAADALVRQMTGSPAAVVHNPIQEEIL
ncbi:MAG: hypothetical protein ACRC1K_06910, partial [Planctomycetia bacterium]